MQPGSGNNPLLNRLYDTTSNKKKRKNSFKDESTRDKVLIPKLKTKSYIQSQPQPVQKQKAAYFKSNIPKLPSISQKQTQFKKGDINVQNSYLKKQRSITSSKKLFEKQRKLSYKESENYFPTELSFNLKKQQQASQQIKNQVSQKTQRSLTVHKNRNDTKTQEKSSEELFQFLSIIEKSEQLKQQFCYMNRGELPYSYQMVEYQNINPNQFLVVSIRGITIYLNGQASEMTTADKLGRQIELYMKVRKIGFFQDYIKQKTFKHWRYNTNRRKFEAQCKTIQENLLSQKNMLLQQYISYIFNIAVDYHKCKFLDISVTKSGSLQDFTKILHNKEVKIIKSINYLDNAVKKKLKLTIQQNLIKFKQEQRVSLGTPNEKKQQAYLPFDTKKKPMKYTQMAKLKSFQESMYRLIKMTDLLKFNIKRNFIFEGLINYSNQLQNQHHKYLNRNKVPNFVSWVSIEVKIQKKDSQSLTKLICQPSLLQIRKILQTHRNNIINKIGDSHELLIQNKDQLYCQNYSFQSQIPNRLDLKYDTKNNINFKIQLQRCQKSLQACLNDIEQYINKGEQILLGVYDECHESRAIEYYMQNQTLKKYLQVHADTRKNLAKWESKIDFGIAYITMENVVNQIKDKFQEKYKNIIEAIPPQVLKRCQCLASNIKNIYNIFKDNPSTIQQYIKAVKDYNIYKPQMEILQTKIEEIYELEETVYKNGLRIGELAKQNINQCSTYFRQLNKRLQQIQSNQQKDRKKFEKAVDCLVEPLDQKSQSLYQLIYEDSLIGNSQSNPEDCIKILQSYQQSFGAIKSKKKDLFYYQNQLKMGHKDIPNFFKLQSSLQWLIKLWKGRKQQKLYEKYAQTQGYSILKNLDLQPLKTYLRNIDLSSSQVQQVDLLQNFKQQTQNLQQIFDVCHLLVTETLQHEHFKEIKSKIQTNNTKIKDLLFTTQGGNTITCMQLIEETNILQIKTNLEQISFSSAQESIIHKHLKEIDEFWKKSRIAIKAEDLARNQTEILHLASYQNQKLCQNLGYHLITMKNIYGSKHSVGKLKSLIANQVQNCQYTTKLLNIWEQVQKQWIKLLPLMTNCPSVKHQSNVFFQFTSTDTTIKKHNRKIADLTSMRKIIEDKDEQRYYNILENCQKELKQINKIFNNFLELKRNTYQRFFFITDQELITILQKTKGLKSLVQYARFCFNCDRLILDKELISGFQTANQNLKLRKTIIKGEADQMFRSIQENMKSSIKLSIMGLLPKMKIGINIEQQHNKDYSLQTVIMCDKLIWTEMTQNYLETDSYESYQLVLRKPVEQLVKYLKKSSLSKQLRLKISMRLNNLMNLRQLGTQMMNCQSSKDDFKWKSQIKYHLEHQQIYITQFDRKLNYGLQYYPPSKIVIPTKNWNMLLEQIHYTALHDKVLLVKGEEGNGKRSLLKSCASQFGIFYRQLVCNQNISIQYIMRFVQGAIVAGTWLGFYQFQYLQRSVLSSLVSQIQRLVTKLRGDVGNSMTDSVNIQASNQISLNKSSSLSLSTGGNIVLPPQFRISSHTLFSFTTHGFKTQQLSIYSFDSFVVAEPNKKKICQWLLHLQNFDQWHNLSSRLIAFMDTVFPILERVMGSYLSILRKIIDNAALKRSIKIERGQKFIKEKEIIAITFKEQVIDKSSENIHKLLDQAVLVYFDTNVSKLQQQQQKHQKTAIQTNQLTLSAKNKHYTKTDVICSLINKKTKNILVIGPRSNKTTIIEQSCQKLNRELMKIYPMADEQFFYGDSPQKMNQLDENIVVVYDGQNLIRQWSDLIISGYLIVQGRKIELKNQIIMEIRDVKDCTPSFVGSCQVVYIGDMLSKKQKFLLKSEADISQESCKNILQTIYQIFGNQLQNLPLHLIEPFAIFIKQYVRNIQSKNYHKLFTWFGTILGIKGLWNRFYGGKYTDLTVNKYSHQLIPIDQSKYFQIQENLQNRNSVLIHTKNSILYYELIRNLMNLQQPILLSGGLNCGKSTLVKMIISSVSESNNGRINLPVTLSTQQWSKNLKQNLTNIRKEGVSYLMNIGHNQIIVTVDDLDLGTVAHRQYLRQIIDNKTIRDAKFQKYTFQVANLVISWHKSNQMKNSNQGTSYGPIKLIDRLIQLELPQFTKDSIQTILRLTLDNFTKRNKMNKQVVNVIDNSLIKCLIILFDDVANIQDSNNAANLVLAILRNLVSLPRKNYFINLQNYVKFFKINLKSRMFEKCFSSKSQWKINSIYENLDKVIFGPKNSKVLANDLQLNQSIQSKQNQQETQTYICLDKQYRTISKQKIKQKILSVFPNVYIFPQMLQIVIKLNNQLQNIDSNCVIIGRNGTGKKTIMKLAALLNKIQIQTTIGGTVFQCSKNKDVILYEEYDRRYYQQLMDGNAGTLYKQLISCNSDQEIERLIQDSEIRKKYLEQRNQEQGLKERIVKKVKQKIRNVLILNNIAKLKRISLKFRQVNRYYICFIDQWPIQALLNISGAYLLPKHFQTDNQSIKQIQDHPQNNKQFNIIKVLAEVYTKTNKIFCKNEEHSISIKKFQRFLKLYNQMYQTRKSQANQKIQFYTKIYSKFHEACTMISQWEGRVQVLKKQLSQTLNKLDTEIKHTSKEEQTFTTLHLKMLQEEDIIREKNNEMAQIQRQMESKIVHMKKVMNDIEKIVMSIQRSQMSELKKIYKNNKVVSFGLECLCLLFDQEISQKAINKILADPNLMMKMKSQNILTKRNMKVEEKMKTELDQIKQSLQNAKGNITNIKILIEWIKALMEYWGIHEEYQSQKQNYKSHKSIFEQSKKRQNEIEDEVNELKSKTLALHSHLSQTFKQREQTLSEYNKISIKIENAKKLVPSLKKSEEQTWVIIKNLREQIECLNGNLILSVACLVFLPLSRLKLKNLVINQIKKILNLRMVSFSIDFMSKITKVDDAILQDLNVQALKQFNDLTIIIIDPQRSALNYIFERDIDLHSIIKSVSKDHIESETASPKRDMIESVVYKKQQNQKDELQKTVVQQSRINFGDYVSEVETQVNPYKRDAPVYHTTQQNIKKILLQLPNDCLIVDWKYTSLDNNTKIFMKIAANKKPQYFEVKKQLNIKIKKDLIRIQNLKRKVYETICEKQIKVLDDGAFVELSQKLQQLQIQTVKNKELQKIKTNQIQVLANQINDQVTKIIKMVTSLKKIRNIALDTILDIACMQGNTIENIIRYSISILHPDRRLGWLLAVAFEFKHQGNQQFYSILVKDYPLKINQSLRIKKPLGLSSNNFQNLVKLSQYSNNLKQFCDISLKYPKDFELWTLDLLTQTLPQAVKLQNLKLSFLQQLLIYKIFKRKIFMRVLVKGLKFELPYNLTPYQNKELLLKVNPKYPIIAHCPYQYLQKLAQQINDSKIVRKNLIELQKQVNMKYYIWKQMQNGYWMVLHSLSTQKSLQILHQIVQYVMNYDEQKSFRIFIYVDKIQEQGFKSKDQKQIESSKYLENIGIHLYDEPISLFRMIQRVYKDSPATLLYRKIVSLCYLAHKACMLRFPMLKYQKCYKKMVQLLQYFKLSEVALEININFLGDALSKIYLQPLKDIRRQIAEQTIIRIVQDTKVHEKSLFGINLMVSEQKSYDKKYDQDLQRNYQLLGMQDSYIFEKEEMKAQNILQTLGQIIYFNRSLKEQISQIRSAISRIPQSTLVFSREFKNKIYVFNYLQEVKKHNEQISKVKQFIQWINNSSTKDFNEEDPELPEQVQALQIFNWSNLLTKVNQMINSFSYSHHKTVTKNKVRAALSNWVSLLKRRHQFLLYWNLDANVFSLHPVLFFRFDKLISIYVLHYLLNNYERIKAEAESRKQNIIYTPQIQFSRQTDQKMLYMTQGILLPDLIYHEFKYNFQVKMLDSLLDRQENAHLIMLKMKKIPIQILEKSTILPIIISQTQNKEQEDGYRSPDIQITIRDTTDGKWRKTTDPITVLKLQTYIDGNYSQWELRRPCLISE